jgi:hypothetical protein
MTRRLSVCLAAVVAALAVITYCGAEQPPSNRFTSMRSRYQNMVDQDGRRAPPVPSAPSAAGAFAATNGAGKSVAAAGATSGGSAHPQRQPRFAPRRFEAPSAPPTHFNQPSAPPTHFNQPPARQHYAPPPVPRYGSAAVAAAQSTPGAAGAAAAAVSGGHVAPQGRPPRVSHYAPPSHHEQHSAPNHHEQHSFRPARRPPMPPMPAVQRAPRFQHSGRFATSAAAGAGAGGATAAASATSAATAPTGDNGNHDNQSGHYQPPRRFARRPYAQSAGQHNNQGHNGAGFAVSGAVAAGSSAAAGAATAASVESKPSGHDFHSVEESEESEHYEEPETVDEYAAQAGTFTTDGNGVASRSYNRNTEFEENHEEGEEDDDQYLNSGSYGKTINEGHEEFYNDNNEDVEHTPTTFRKKASSTNYSKKVNKNGSESGSSVLAKNKHRAAFKNTGRRFKENVDRASQMQGSGVFHNEASSEASEFDENEEEAMDSRNLGNFVGADGFHHARRPSFNPAAATSSAAAASSNGGASTSSSTSSGH